MLHFTDRFSFQAHFQMLDVTKCLHNQNFEK